MDLPFVGAKKRSQEEKTFCWLWQELMLLHKRGHEDADGESEGFLPLRVGQRLKNAGKKSLSKPLAG